MIVDVVDGDIFFVSEQVVRRYIIHSKEQHFFIIKVSNVDLERRYCQLFADLNYSLYHISSDIPVTQLPFLVKILLLTKKNLVSNREKDFLKTVYLYRNETVLLHGNLFSAIFTYLLLLSRWKDLNWVCWGNFLAERKADSFKIAVQLQCLRILYRKFKRIVCLMQPDVIKAKEKFACRHVFLCPYPTDWSKVPEKLEIQSENDKILIGNSGHIVYEYINLATQLIPYCHCIDLTFMLCYGSPVLEPKIKELREILERESFHYELWDYILPLDEYREKMKQYQYYVCPFVTQTGLGAIYTMIEQCKTVYLTGYNLTWFRYLNISVFSVDELLEKLKQNDSLEMDLEKRIANRKRMHELFNAERRMNKLNELLTSAKQADQLDSNFL